MRKVLIVGSVCLFLVPALVLVGCGGGDEDSAKTGAQMVCPVMGQKIDKKYYVDYKGSAFTCAARAARKPSRLILRNT